MAAAQLVMKCSRRDGKDGGVWIAYERIQIRSWRLVASRNKKHLKNAGPIRHCEPPHAALTFTRCRYCGVARRLRIDVYNDDDDNDNA